MDLTDPQVWKDGVSVVIGAPHIVIPLVFAAAGSGWWLKSAIAKGAKEALTERLKLATEREVDAKEKRDELERQVQELRARVAAGAPKEELAAISARVDTALGEFRIANNEVNYALTATPGRYHVHGAALNFRLGNTEISASGSLAIGALVAFGIVILIGRALHWW